jgi:hypothetical protein
MIISFTDWLGEGLDFKENFTPLYHITTSRNLEKILKSDMLKIGRPAKGPRGICVTRSKFFEESPGDCRIILNAEELRRHGYRSYPVDEWALIDKDRIDRSTTRKDWADKDAIRTKHGGKSNFSKMASRPISHNIPSLSHVRKGQGLEVEYEERILKQITRLGRLVYGINLMGLGMTLDDGIFEFSSMRPTIENYLEKYPHIKLYKGRFYPKEVDIDELFS